MYTYSYILVRHVFHRTDEKTVEETSIERIQKPRKRKMIEIQMYMDYPSSEIKSQYQGNA